jgi:hypothetical protein
LRLLGLLHERHWLHGSHRPVHGGHGLHGSRWWWRRCLDLHASRELRRQVGLDDQELGDGRVHLGDGRVHVGELLQDREILWRA